MELILGLKHYQCCSSPIPVMSTLPFAPSPTLTTEYIWDDKCPGACKCWGRKMQKLWQCIRVWTAVYQCHGSTFALTAGKTAFAIYSRDVIIYSLTVCHSKTRFSAFHETQRDFRLLFLFLFNPLLYNESK